MRGTNPSSVFCSPYTMAAAKGSFYDLSDFQYEGSNEVDEEEVLPNENNQGFEAILENSNHLSIVDSFYEDQLSNKLSEQDDDTCRYKVEKIERTLKLSCLGKDRRDAIFSLLENMGIKTFIIVAGQGDTCGDISKNVKQVSQFVSKLNRTCGEDPYKRCLLFQDTRGRMYNLLFKKERVGSVGRWQSHFNSFSALFAITALVVLARSVPCLVAGNVDQLRPTYMGVIIGLVFTEEIRYSWLNNAMLVRSFPSLAAYAIDKNFTSDWLFSMTMVCLLLGGAKAGNINFALSYIGILLCFVILLANLGSRAWHFIKWKPFCYDGPLAPVMAYTISIITGLMFPYLTHRQVESGGKVAVECVVKTAILPILIFILSDFDVLQRFLIIGSESTDQSLINYVVGGWLAASLLINTIVAAQITPQPRWPENTDLILTADQKSPVGYRVPSLPDFELDPTSAAEGYDDKNCTTECEMYLTVLLSVTICVMLMALAFTDWDEIVRRGVENLLLQIYS